MSEPTDNIISRSWSRLLGVYNEYPNQFWILVLGTFIDRLGGALLFPFFTLYITQKFNVGMTQVGLIFATFSVSSVVGGFFGGALTDRVGRKSMLLFGLITSGLSSLLMGIVNQIEFFFVVTIIVGLLSNTAGPAQQAMVADLLPEEKRTQGFGILRVVVNLAVTIGPMIGGLLAATSFMLLFISDAVASLITAGIVYFVLKETMRPLGEEEQKEGIGQTLAGYGKVLRDMALVWFLAASVLMVLVYMQMNTTLPVYLRDMYGISPREFGYILSLNAGMVVLFQFPITRRISKYRPLVVMTVGTLFYAVGFAMYGVVSAFAAFLLAMVIITIGEMFVAPTGQAIVAQLAPEDMRGRYMAVFGFSWMIPIAVGPLLAGLVMDNADPRWVWYGGGILALISAAAYYTLELRVERAHWSAVGKRLKIMEMVEEGHVSAEEAAIKLAGVSDKPWGRLAPGGEQVGLRHMRIRVNDLSSNTMKVDLRLPLGLVNVALDAGSQLSSTLDHLEDQKLKEAISSGGIQGATSSSEKENSQQIEIIIEEDD
jgi:MFS family permease